MRKRNMMKLTDSLYHECQTATLAKRMAMGDQLELNNNFAWEKVVMKLTGTKEYDC